VTLLNNNEDAGFSETIVATDYLVRFRNVPFGEYTLIIEQEGFIDYIIETLSVRRAEVSHDAELVLLPVKEYAVVTINLLVPDGYCPVGAVVTLTMNCEYLEYVFYEISDGDYVIFDEVPFGIYTLTVVHYGFEDYVYEMFTVENAEVNLEVKLELLPVDMLATVTIYLSVPDGYSPEGAIVSLTLICEYYEYVFNEIADGDYVIFEKVPFGDYTLNIVHEGFIDYVIESLPVRQAEVSHDAELELLPIVELATVTIFLKAPEGYSPVGAIVTLANKENPEYAFVLEALENSVTFTDIPFGTYSLSVTHDLFIDYINEEFEVRYYEVKHEVYLVLKTATVAINLIFPTENTPVPSITHIQISINDDRDYLFWASTRDNYVLFENVPFGSYSIVAVPQGFSTYFYVSLQVFTFEIIHEIYIQQERVEQPDDIWNLERYPFRVELWGDEIGVVLPSQTLGSRSPIVKINDSIIPFIGASFNKHYPWGYFISSRYQFTHDAGQRYQIRMYNHFDWQFGETIYITAVQYFEANFPNNIDENEFRITWEMLPDDTKDVVLTFMRIRKFQSNSSIAYWEQVKHMSNSARELIVPAGFIPSPADGRVTFQITKTNYVVYYLFIYINSRHVHAEFKEGNRQW
jgi:uncharacterized protein YjaG (DUF416 family)